MASCRRQSARDIFAVGECTCARVPKVRERNQSQDLYLELCSLAYAVSWLLTLPSPRQMILNEHKYKHTNTNKHTLANTCICTAKCQDKRQNRANIKRRQNPRRGKRKRVEYSQHRPMNYRRICLLLARISRMSGFSGNEWMSLFWLTWFRV